VMTLIANFDPYRIELLDENFCKLINLDGPQILDEHQYSVYMSFDPMTNMYFNRKHDEFTRGQLLEAESHATIYDAERKPYEYNIFSFSITVGRPPFKYLAHFFCRAESMRILQAYAYFDFFTLTHQQKKVLELLVYGRNRDQIAEALSISPRTAEKHIEQVLLKAGLSSPMELITAVLS